MELIHLFLNLALESSESILLFIERRLSMKTDALKETVDDLSIKWNAANDRELKEAREEIGDNFYYFLRKIEIV